MSQKPKNNMRTLLFVISLASAILACGPLDLGRDLVTRLTIGCSVDRLISAMESAGDREDPSIITLESGCEYVLTEVYTSSLYHDDEPPSNIGPTGLPPINSMVTIRAEDHATITRSQAPGIPAFRILATSGRGSHLILENVTVSGGHATHETDIYANGGGILSQGDLTLTGDTQIVDNVADFFGGGIIHWEMLTIPAGSSVEISRNHATSGGGIKSHGNLNISSGLFNGNTAVYGGGISNSRFSVDSINADFIENHAEEDGGAIDNWGGLESLSGNFIGNSARRGGAVHNAFRDQSDAPFNTLIISNSTFERNEVSGTGGAIHNHELIEEAVIQTSLFVENEAGESGAAVQNDGSLTITNTTFSANFGPAAGGAAIFNLGDLVLSYSTITENRGIGGAVVSATGSIEIANSIIANNSSSDCNILSAHTKIGTDIDTDGSCPLFLSVEDAGLTPLADNGGPTLTHALRADSPALDSAAGVCPAADQRGFARPQGTGCEVGAYEEFVLVFDPDAPLDPPQVPSEPMAPMMNADTLCWTGPGKQYSVVSTVKQGTKVELLGTGQQAGWWVIDNPRYPGVACWLPEDKLDVDPNLDLSTLKVFPVPQLPTATFTPAPAAPPKAPTGLAAAELKCNTTNGYIVKLTWKDNANNETGYRVYHNGGLIATLGANATQFTSGDLGTGAAQSFYVQAFNSAGTAKSNIAQEDGCIY